jgi:hypothetical protein
MFAVMPAMASARTASQSTAARSAGVRAIPARNLALYDRTMRMNCVVSTATPVMKSAGIGKFGEAPPGPRAIAIAESSIANAWAFTTAAAKSESSGVRDGVNTAAESKIIDMLPIA